MSEINTMGETPQRRGVPIWVQAIILVVLLGALAFVAWGLAKSQQESVQTGEVVPNFTLNFFDKYEYQGKKEISIADLKGQVVVLNFWASWCIPCEQEAAPLEAAWKYYQPTGKVIFIGVDYVDTEPEALTYLARFGVSYPNAPDLQMRISKPFRISGVPETYIIDQTGKIAASKIGPFTTEAEIRALVDPLLK
jgi:cytochrome c biogenesis protein CcmG/thiol:disulfide interchange protein DsbE